MALVPVSLSFLTEKSYMVETVNTFLNYPKNFESEDIKYSMRQNSLEKIEQSNPVSKMGVHVQENCISLHTYIDNMGLN